MIYLATNVRLERGMRAFYRTTFTIGPDTTTTLRERYDVSGVPTTLFVRGGEVESRLLGSHHKEAVGGELDALLDDE